MIYRAIIEGDNTTLSKAISDTFEVFFSAYTRNEAQKRLEAIFYNLFPGDHYLAENYICCNLMDETELKRNAMGPNAFADAYLVETGNYGADISYVTDTIVMSIGDDRQRILAAIEQGHAVNQKNEIAA